MSCNKQPTSGCLAIYKIVTDKNPLVLRSYINIYKINAKNYIQPQPLHICFNMFHLDNVEIDTFENLIFK